MNKLSTKTDYVNFLGSLKRRVGLLHTPEQAKLILDGSQCFNASLEVNTGLNGMIEAIEQGEDAKQHSDWQALLQAAHGGDPVARAEVTQIRTIRTMNYLRAFSKWLGFFEQVERKANEAIYWENESRQDVKIRFSGPDGKPKLSQILKLRQRVFIELQKLTSEDFEYPLVDPYRGSVADEIKALIDIAAEMEEQVNQFLRPFVDGSLGLFSTFNTGAKSNRAFVLHPVLAAAGNIPSTNDIDVSGSSNGRIGKVVLDAIINYQAAWSDVFNKQPLHVKAILAPSADSRGILNDITLTSFGNTLSEQVMTEGWLMEYAGEKFGLIPDATLSFSAGYVYVQFDQPLGEVIFTPELDAVVDDDKTKRKQNLGSMYAEKWIGAVVPTPNIPKVLRVKYK